MSATPQGVEVGPGVDIINNRTMMVAGNRGLTYQLLSVRLFSLRLDEQFKLLNQLADKPLIADFFLLQAN